MVRMYFKVYFSSFQNESKFHVFCMCIVFICMYISARKCLSNVKLNGFAQLIEIAYGNSTGLYELNG